MSLDHSQPDTSAMAGQKPRGLFIFNGGVPSGESDHIPKSPRVVLHEKDFLRETVVFDDLRRLVLWANALRGRVETAIEDLPKEFNRAFRRTTLRLRAWPRKKGDPPFALYWIHLPPRRKIVEDFIERVLEKMEARRRWHFRLKIRTSRDLDRAIHRGGLDHSRREVHRFHRRAGSLNQAHKILTGALDSIRKMLQSKAGGRLPGFDPGPSPYPSGFVPDVDRLVGMIWRLERVIQKLQGNCHDLVHAARHKPLWQPYRLAFPEDREHPYGRFLWVCDVTGRTYSTLSYRVRRRLGLADRVSRMISPFEAARRRADRALRASVALVRRIKLKVPPAIRQATALLAAAGGVNQKEVVG